MAISPSWSSSGYWSRSAPSVIFSSTSFTLTSNQKNSCRFLPLKHYVCALMTKFNVFQIVQGFSAYTNTLRVFSTDTVGPDSLESINGIRFLSISWVIVGHCYNMYDDVFIQSDQMQNIN